MSGSISSIQTQPTQNDIVLQQGGQSGEIQALEQAVQELLSALQSRDGGGSAGSAGSAPEQAVQQQLAGEQQADQGVGGGGVPGAGGDTAAVMPDTDTAVGGQDSEIQSLEQAVQELLGALQQGQSGGTTPGATQASSTPDTTTPATTTPAASAPAGGAGQSTGAGTPGTLASDYNDVLSQVAANGNSAQDIQQAVQKFLQDADASGDNSDQSLQQAMNNILGSLQDGTYSQQGSEGALQGAAQRDGLGGVNTVSVAGKDGGAEQASGAFDAASNAKGSLGANTAILESEISSGGSAGSQQITNNAGALANEADAAAKAATSSGDTQAASQDQALATAARNIANSAQGSGDGSYDAQASLSALQSALPDATATNATATPSVVKPIEGTTVNTTPVDA
ncbi:hypothetical protein FHR90_003113 [Endobacter medicaginis]|uniref:Uncharacterized protein n=3 Tax=Endobacter medicaginis TaxID=1181271 RepID=A0A839V6V1_9PROT|nr:hypothetical protein [Endobacter medicaginis]MBB3175259.1 hypothetical protein [Endobacter medicaginis]MCX5476599.1 hypothetical protein [Endobacter medicaginis]